MTFIYRFHVPGAGVDFPAPGRLMKAEGCYVVIAEIGYDQAMLLQKHASFGQPITIWVDVDGAPVAFMQCEKIRARDHRGRFVEIMAAVYIPDIFAQALKA